MGWDVVVVVEGGGEGGGRVKMWRHMLRMISKGGPGWMEHSTQTRERDRESVCICDASLPLNQESITEPTVHL